MGKETISAYLRRMNGDEAMVMKAALQEELFNLVNNDFVDVENLEEAISYKQVNPMNSPIQMKDPEPEPEVIRLPMSISPEAASSIIGAIPNKAFILSDEEIAARQQQIEKDYINQKILMSLMSK